MGHAIQHVTFPASMTQKQITDAVLSAVAEKGYGTTQVQFTAHTTFDSYTEAEDFIASIDKGWYGGYAVPYRDYDGVEPSKKILALRKKASDIIKKRDGFMQTHSVQKMKAMFVTCPKCRSKLNRERIRGQVCPLCYTDLRTESTLQHIRAFDKEAEELQNQILQEQKKEKDKASVRWLVKYEYHI